MGHFSININEVKKTEYSLQGVKKKLERFSKNDTLDRNDAHVAGLTTY